MPARNEMDFLPGTQAAFAVAPEVDYPAEDGSHGSIPSSPALVGPSDIPDVAESEGSKTDGDLANIEDTYDLPGGRRYDGSVAVKIRQPAFIINYCQPTQAGGLGSSNSHLGMPCFAAWYGARGDYFTGYGKVGRYGHVGQIDLSFNNESAKELMATIGWRFLFPQASQLATPTYSTLQALGAPLTWHNVTDITAIDSLGATHALRPKLSAWSLRKTMTIVDEPWRPDTGDDDYISRTLYGMKVTEVKHALSMTFESPDIAAALVNGSSNATAWGSGGAAITLLASNAANIAPGDVLKTFTITVNAARLLSRKQRSGARSSQMGTTVEAVCRNVVFST